MQRHTVEELIPHPHCCENLKTRVVLCTTWKHLGEWRNTPPILNFGARQGKKSNRNGLLYSLNARLDGPQSRCAFFDDKKDLFHLPGNEERSIGSLSQRLVTMPIALPWLLKAWIHQECIQRKPTSSVSPSFGWHKILSSYGFRRTASQLFIHFLSMRRDIYWMFMLHCNSQQETLERRREVLYTICWLFCQKL
jgi:hypothetical protein